MQERAGGVGREKYEIGRSNAREESRKDKKREREKDRVRESGGRRKGLRSERVESFTGDNYGRIAKRCTTARSTVEYIIFLNHGYVGVCRRGNYPHTCS